MGEVKPKSVNTLQKGHYVLIEGDICTIVDVQSSKGGKHGHSKYRIEAVGMKDGRKRQVVMPSGSTVDTPVIEKRNAQILSIVGNKVNAMDAENYETFDMPLSDEFKDNIQEGTIVLYWDMMGEKVIKGIKGAVDVPE
ncbi:MAG: translation initiation factor IF-5A [Nanoarchaeota archaeon]